MPHKAPRSLEALFSPRSAVVIGASADPSKWGALLAGKLLRGSSVRPVYLVNRNGSHVLGQNTYTALNRLPEVPEFAAIAVPQTSLQTTIDEVLDAGVRALVVVTAGVGETGDAGREIQEQIVKRVHAADAVMLGPNCSGIFDSSAQFDCLPWTEPVPGSIGLICQSGTMIIDMARRAEAYGLGISRAASIGNQADVSVAELVQSLAQHDATDATIIYVEGITDGRDLFDAIHRSVLAGTPVVVLAAPAAEAANRAAQSHTGSLLSDGRLLIAACEAAGAFLATSIREAVDMAYTLRGSMRTSGRRLGVITEGGGYAVLSASMAERHQFEVTPFSDLLQEKLRQVTGPGSGLGNPVDSAGVLRTDEMLPVVEAVVDSGEVDCILMPLGVFNSDSPEREREVGELLAAMALRSGVPVAVASQQSTNPGIQALKEARIPVFTDLEVAAEALSWLVRANDPVGVAVSQGDHLLPEDATTYFGARQVLEESGISFAPAIEVESEQDALNAATECGYPVVLKALGQVHKSDAGGVVVAIKDSAALVAAMNDMRARLAPPSFSVESCLDTSRGVELIIGGHRDPRFGPVVLVGLGGVFTEVLSDSSIALAPVTRDQSLAMLRSLKGFSLLRGVRGRNAVNLDALADAIVSVSTLMASTPEIEELDINPILATSEGATGLDARIIRRDG